MVRFIAKFKFVKESDDFFESRVANSGLQMQLKFKISKLHTVNRHLRFVRNPDDERWVEGLGVIDKYQIALLARLCYFKSNKYENPILSLVLAVYVLMRD